MPNVYNAIDTNGVAQDKKEDTQQDILHYLITFRWWT